jgi:hypothetical protein
MMKLTRKTAIRRQRRKVGGSISELPPETSYSYHIDFVQVSADGQTVHKVPCREYITVGELKEYVVRTLNRHQDEENDGKWKVSDVVLVYSLNEQEFELFNEYQFIYSTALYQSWADEGCTLTPDTTVLRVRSAGRTGERDGKIMARLGHLTGLTPEEGTPANGVESGCLWRVADGDWHEVQWARRLLHSYVKSEVAARDEGKYCLSMELVSRRTSTILSLKIPLDNKVEITFHYQQIFSLVKKVNIHRTAVSVLEELYQCVVACGLIDQEKHQSSDFVLQVSGERSYIAGQDELLSFKDIRRCIIKSEPIHLSISPRPCRLSDTPFQIHSVPVDANSGQPPLHTDIAALSHKECESQALSVWDVKDELSLQVVKLDQLPVRSLTTRTPLVVEVSLYHGATQLCQTQQTSPQPLNGLIRIKETMNFKIAKKDVPKSARLMFVVRESSQRKECTVGTRKTQARGSFLYWGLVSLIDHQSMLRMGEVQMALWRGSSRDGDDWYTPCPCTPPYSNPDPRAVTLTVKFDSYSFPVYYPATIPQSWTSLLGMDESNTALRKQFLRLIDLIKEGKLHGALPTYIEKLEWGNLSKTLEVYSLLTELMEAKHFPVETALKMLDSNFPDEHVRKFAVSALHELADDELEDILLQLTQALKFEPHHDSPLARLLLKRALHNKRIGHFFFWYLKCELHNPLYAQRCGVILEAYLKGCGESMLRQFEDQVDIQMKLEEIALELKQRCSDDQSKMQSLLPELLETHGVPTFTLTPVYNPRIRLGNLRPNKCKVMSSKKKPQWLEMYNVDPTVLRQSPIRLILKLGDDLRQDMITLRMLSLFEKLWEEDGLSDLCLIPYGCMATGPKTGFIEVVNNARTIAEVSGVSNQSKLLDWIRSHQTNEFGELDPEKLKTAVKKFAHSCAGYSVATYVLGVGDRHNDNIMVTTSGNLFHIDFGHFLGNQKKFMGVNRERAPFVLTPDFEYVMGKRGSDLFKRFEETALEAYMVIRRNANLFINLFSMMKCTGIPELRSVEDIEYLRGVLFLGRTEDEAKEHFKSQIQSCLKLAWRTQLNFLVHNYAHSRS